MTAEQFVNEAIKKGQSHGLASLTAAERMVFLIAEAEADCDMNGIDSLLDRYNLAEIKECAAAFKEIGASRIADILAMIAEHLPVRREQMLSDATDLITSRADYDYEAIASAVAGRLR